MKKILILILLVTFFSCEKKIPFEDDKKIPLDSIDWEDFKRRLWCENDSILLVFDNNTEH